MRKGVRGVALKGQIPPHKCLSVSKCRFPTLTPPRREDDNQNNNKLHQKQSVPQAGAAAPQQPIPAKTFKTLSSIRTKIVRKKRLICRKPH